MSNNKREQDLNEIECLESVKTKFKDECLFGGTTEDFEQLKKLVFTCKIDEKQTKFPDFIGENGFIEHFQITSSKTTKKGQVHAKKMSKLKREDELTIDDIKNHSVDSENSDGVYKYTNLMMYPNHDYSCLVDSIKKTWNNHLKKLESYNGPKEIKVFMIQYNDICALQMFEEYPAGVEGMYMGDFPKHKAICYRISRDNNILDILYESKDKIDYVIFKSYSNLEIIKLKSIPVLKKLNPYPYKIEGTCATLYSNFYSWVNFKKR